MLAPYQKHTYPNSNKWFASCLHHICNYYIHKRGHIIPQYQHTSVEDEYACTYENTLPGITNLPTPIAKSTPVTQASHISVTKTITERDIV